MTREAATARIELRAQRGPAERIRYAARLRRQSLSAFVLDAAAERAEEVIASASTTVVPSEFFDKLWAALDRPPKRNAALARRAAMKRSIEQR